MAIGNTTPFFNVPRPTSERISGTNRSEESVMTSLTAAPDTENTRGPDLSNTAFLVDALKACGRGSDDPAIQKHWYLCRAVKTWKPNTTRRRLPAKIQMAASIIRVPLVGRAPPV